MANEPAKEREMVRFTENISSVLSQPSLRLARREAAAAAFHSLQDIIGREPVDVVVYKVRHARLALSEQNRVRVSRDFRTCSRDKAARSSSNRGNPSPAVGHGRSRHISRSYRSHVPFAPVLRPKNRPP